MRSKLSSKLWGCFFILFGVLIIGNLFDFWDITLFFSGWCTLLIRSEERRLGKECLGLCRPPCSPSYYKQIS